MIPSNASFDDVSGVDCTTQGLDNAAQTRRAEVVRERRIGQLVARPD